MAERVDHPQHYQEKFEVIEAYGLGFHRGNVVKYVLRAGKKKSADAIDKEIEDLSKAMWYLRREIEVLKASRKVREPVRPNETDPNWKKS